MYMLVAFTVTGAVLYGYLAVVEARRRDFVLFGLFTLASALTHYFGLVAVAGNCLVLAVLAILRRRSQVRPLLVVSGAVAVLYLPWLPMAFRQRAGVVKSFWAPQLSFDLILFAHVAPFNFKFEDIVVLWQPRVVLAIFN